jgi:hypothetical protein
VGRPLVAPPVPLCLVQEMWYPWYQTSSMQFCFKGQIGRNIEVYVDDIIVKSR